MSILSDKSLSMLSAAVASHESIAESNPRNVASATPLLVDAYQKENSPRWGGGEVTRITNYLNFLPDKLPTQEGTIKLKQSIL